MKYQIAVLNELFMCHKKRIQYLFIFSSNAHSISIKAQPEKKKKMYAMLTPQRKRIKFKVEFLLLRWNIF
jgi:hypothetical protein